MTPVPLPASVKVWLTFTVALNVPEPLLVKEPSELESAVVPFGSSAACTRIPVTPALLLAKPAPVTWMNEGEGRFWPSPGVTSRVTPGWS